MQLLLALMALSTAHMAQGYVDSSGFESFGDTLPNSYRLHRERVSWDVAAGVCRLEGAHLMVVDSEDESVLANLLFGRLPYYSPPMAWGFDLLHLGITDKAKEGQWLTVLGKPINPKSAYNKWGSGEPNNYEKAEHCGTMNRIGQLHDIKCNGDLGHLCAFVCEKENSDEESLIGDVRGTKGPNRKVEE